MMAHSAKNLNLQCSQMVAVLLLVVCNLQRSDAWGWLLIGNWSSVDFTLPCEYQSCIQVTNENTSAQLSSYRCRGLSWWQEQYTYNNISKQLTTQPRQGPAVCVDLQPNSTLNVGVSQCNATSKSQQWSFVNGTKIQNGLHNNLYLAVQQPSGEYLTQFAGASLPLIVAAAYDQSSTSGQYSTDFTLIESAVLSNYTPRLPQSANTTNLVRNGLFASNWREPLGLEAGDMTEICNWTILADLDLITNDGKDTYGRNIQLNAGPQHVNRHGQMGAISQLVPTFAGQEHSLLFQGSGLGTCGSKTKVVTVSIFPSSVPSTTISFPAGVGWQPQLIDFVANGSSVNLTFTSASDAGSLCGPNITDIKIGLKGVFTVEPASGGLKLSGLDLSLISGLGASWAVTAMAMVTVLVLVRRLKNAFRAIEMAHSNKFSLEQIRRFSNDFAYRIGEGGNSVVYRGEFPDGTKLAIKRAKRFDVGFEEEVQMLGRVHHRRVVRFLGYCDDSSEQILILEGMENGSLFDNLHRRPQAGGPVLTLDKRLKIARDVAVGLEYLHHGANPGIIHRDIKAANVLLDGKMSAKLADFGSFKQGHDNTFSINIPMDTATYKGTYGYMDPAYASNLTISTKSDVFSFGVLLLELVSGLKATEVHGLMEPEKWLDDPRVSDEDLLAMVDPALKTDRASRPIDTAKVRLMLSTACQCMLPTRDDRPCMLEVVRLLGPVEDYEEPTPGTMSVSRGESVSLSDNNACEPLMHTFSIQESVVSQGR